MFIGIEVKYKSGLSSGDQLLRELKVIDDKRNDKKALLLFIAQSKGIAEAKASIDKLGKDLHLLEDISFAYITWEDIYEIYNQLNLEDYNDYEKLIMEDIRRLLKLKGFEKFKSFEIDKEYNIQDEFFIFTFKKELDFNFQFDINVGVDFYEFR